MKELREVINHTDVRKFNADHGISWKYISEHATWWGGFYERMVHPMKMSLRKNLGRLSLTHSEIEVYLVDVETIISSRPLTRLF